MRLQAFDTGIFYCKSYFKDDATRNSFVFQPNYRCFKKTGNSKGLSEESIEPSTTFSDSFYPSSNYISNKIQLKFDESCLKQEVLNMYQTRCTKLH